MQAFYVIELAVLGLAVGSFLNVVIHRLPNDESIVRPRSPCPKCGHQLAWYENVPVVSWVLLRGRCSACKAPISVRYVLVELLTGSLFMGALVRFGWTWELVLGLTFITVVVPLVFIDAEHWVLPFELTLPGLGLGLLLQVPRGWPAVRDALIGAAAGFILFRVMELAGWYFARKEALGGGDKYLLALIGAFMGWKVLLGVILLSSLQGAVFGLARIALTGRAAPELPPADEPQPPGGSAAPPPASQRPPGSSADVTAGTVKPAATTADPVAQGVGLPAQDGSTTAPDGSATAPDRSATAPDVSATAPDVSATAPDVSATAPDRSATAPVRSATAPDRSATAPDGSATAPDGSATAPDGSSPAPEDGAPGVTREDGDGEEDELTFTPDFLRPGLSLGRRLLLLPWTLFVQPIPDDPPIEEGEDEDAEPEWVPGPTNMPFGPWIGLAGLEVMLLGPWISAHLGHGLAASMLRLVFVN